jgi:DNA invertase Pin-like site-specific DNA recombinase
MSVFAAAYIRKSNDQQDRTEDVKSVATQRDLIAAFAASRDWKLEEKHIFADDGITGALFAERPGLQALLAATRATSAPATARRARPSAPTRRACRWPNCTRGSSRP